MAPTAPLDGYLGALARAQGVEIRETEHKGRALYAERPIRAMELVLRDRPLCWLQASPQRSLLTCAACARPLGSMRAQLSGLLEVHGIDATHLPDQLPVLDNTAVRPALRVHDGEGMAACWACSEECAARLRLDLAGGLIDHGAWTRMTRQLSATGNDFLVLAAQLLRSVVVLYVSSPPSVRADGSSHLCPMLGLVSPAELQVHTSTAELQASLRAVRACFRRAIARWPELVGCPPSGCANLCEGGIFSLPMWKRCVGAVRANAIRVAVPSPLVRFMESVEALEPSSAERGLLCEQLWPLLLQAQETHASSTSASDDENSKNDGGNAVELSEGSADSSQIHASDSGDSDNDAEDDEQVLFSWGSAPTVSSLPAAESTYTGPSQRPASRCISSRLFRSHDGIAIYPLVSMANHSCRPNAQVCAYVEPGSP